MKSNRATKVKAPRGRQKMKSAKKLVKPAIVLPTEEEVAPIQKPAGFSLDKFKSKTAAAIANVGVLLNALPL